MASVIALTVEPSQGTFAEQAPRDPEVAQEAAGYTAPELVALQREQRPVRRGRQQLARAQRLERTANDIHLAAEEKEHGVLWQVGDALKEIVHRQAAEIHRLETEASRAHLPANPGTAIVHRATRRE